MVDGPEDGWQEGLREGGIEEDTDFGFAGPGLLVSESRFPTALTGPYALTVQCQPVLIVTAKGGLVMKMSVRMHKI